MRNLIWLLSGILFSEMINSSRDKRRSRRRKRRLEYKTQKTQKTNELHISGHFNYEDVEISTPITKDEIPKQELYNGFHQILPEDYTVRAICLNTVEKMQVGQIKVILENGKNEEEFIKFNSTEEYYHNFKIEPPLLLSGIQIQILPEGTEDIKNLYSDKKYSY